VTYEVWVKVENSMGQPGDDDEAWWLVESDFIDRKAAIAFVEEQIEPRLVSSPGWESGYLNRPDGRGGLMPDKLALYDNVRGVFADLDDGGITDDEALNTIRDLVGANGTWEVTVNVRFTATVVAATQDAAEDTGRDAIGAAIDKIRDQFEDDTNIDINGLADGTLRVKRVD